MIQLYNHKIHKKNNFSVSYHPILNPYGWVTHPSPQGTPPEPKNHLKYLKKTKHFLRPLLYDQDPIVHPQNPHKNKFFSISASHPQPPGVVHPPVIQKETSQEPNINPKFLSKNDAFPEPIFK